MKRIISCVLVVILLFFLSACGSKKTITLTNPDEYEFINPDAEFQYDLIKRFNYDLVINYTSFSDYVYSIKNNFSTKNIFDENCYYRALALDESTAENFDWFISKVNNDGYLYLPKFDGYNLGDCSVTIMPYINSVEVRYNFNDLRVIRIFYSRYYELEYNADIVLKNRSVKGNIIEKDYVYNDVKGVQRAYNFVYDDVIVHLLTREYGGPTDDWLSSFYLEKVNISLEEP